MWRKWRAVLILVGVIVYATVCNNIISQLRIGFPSSTKSDYTEKVNQLTQIRRPKQEHYQEEQIEISELLRPFPRWDDPQGINLQDLVEYILQCRNNVDLCIYNDHSRDAETIYVPTLDGIYTSTTMRARLRELVSDRVAPIDEAYKLAIEIVREQPEIWNRLHLVLKNGGFPFVAFYGDKADCNFHNWKKPKLWSEQPQQRQDMVVKPATTIDVSIPIFTLCAKTDCTYAWPQPTYETFRDAEHKSADEWRTYMREQRLKRPLSNKLSKVVWRGSLTGPKVYNKTVVNPRWELAKLVHNWSSPMFDVGLTFIQPDQGDVDLSLIGGLKGSIPKTDFANYRAILDLDGNAWSARFGSLLCMDSVVLKVEPKYVDYFHFSSLTPWQQYIPVKNDLSDLYKKVEFALDVSNTANIQTIISNANKWCMHHMTPNAIAEDVLTIWDAYVEQLERWDPNWQAVWNKGSDSLFKSPHDMADISKLT